MESKMDDFKLYALVNFPDDDGELKSVDMIPRHWITYPETSDDDLYCYYMPVTNDEKLKSKFRRMIRLCEPFDKSWPVHRIEIRGSADSYTEAEIKLEKLTRSTYAYTTESETSAKSRAEYDTKKLKRRNIKCHMKTITEELEGANQDLNNSLNDDEIPEQDGILSQKLVDSDSSSRKITTKKYKKRKLKTVSSSPQTTDSDSSPVIIRSRKSTSEKPKSIPGSPKTDERHGKNYAKKNQEVKLSKSKYPVENRQIDGGSSSSYDSKSKKNIQPEIEKTGIMDGQNMFMKKENEIHSQNDRLIIEHILKSHQSLSAQIGILKGSVIEIKNILEHLRKTGLNFNKTDQESEEKEDEFPLPITTGDDFDKFNEKLKSDEMFRRYFKNKIRPQVNTKGEHVRNLGEIVRIFINRDVALQYTAVKEVKGKKILKDTEFFKHLKDVFVNTHKNEMGDKQFGKLMGGVLNNAKDWDGYRFKRQQETISKNSTKKNETKENRKNEENDSQSEGNSN